MPQAPRRTSRLKNLRRFHFVQIDVFASQRLQGNPLSVFTDARGLSELEMQGLARETNLQETTFVLPRESAVEEREGIRVRIFTPDEEIPFGGHPTLGTATVLRSMRLSGTVKAPHASTSTVVLDLKVGKIPVSFREDGGRLVRRDATSPPQCSVACMTVAQWRRFWMWMPMRSNPTFQFRRSQQVCPL